MSSRYENKKSIVAYTMCPWGPCFTLSNLNNSHNLIYGLYRDICCEKGCCIWWTCCLPCNILLHILFVIGYFISIIIGIIFDIIYLIFFCIPTLIIHKCKTGKFFFKPKLYVSATVTQTDGSGFQYICCKPRNIGLAEACGCSCWYSRSELINDV